MTKNKPNDPASENETSDKKSNDTPPKSKKVPLLIAIGVAILGFFASVKFFFTDSGLYKTIFGDKVVEKNKDIQELSSDENDNNQDGFHSNLENIDQENQDQHAQEDKHDSKDGAVDDNTTYDYEPNYDFGQEESHHDEKSTVDEEGNALTWQYIPLESFIVNLNAADGRAAFVKLNMSVYTTVPKGQEAITNNMPKIRDSVLLYLRELRPDDLKNAAGMYRLREEFIMRINEIIYPDRIDDLRFTDIITQ